MTDELYLKAVDSLPEDFTLDQFTLAFIHFLPDIYLDRFFSLSYDDIKNHLKKHRMKKTIEIKLHAAKRMKRYNPSTKTTEEFWTKNFNKKDLAF